MFSLRALQQTHQQQKTTAVAAHVSSTFTFTLPIPLGRAAPLFGPDGERCWAGPHWSPEFVHPQPGADIPGAVFTVQHDARKAVWVNTVFDKAAGQMQYVCFLPDTLVFTVDVRLTEVSPSVTGIEVTYVRTALSEDANAEVRAMAATDRESGPHWQHAIESCLSQQDRSKP